MRLAVAFVLPLVAACGRIGFGATDGGPGGGGDDAPGGGGGDGGGDGAVAGDGPMPDALIASACATTTIIDDPFTTAGMAGWNAVNTSTFTMAETGGLERFSVPTSVAANTRAALQQAQTQSFSGTCAIAELSRAGTGANVRSYLRLGTPTKNVEIYVVNGQVFGRFTNGGTSGTSGPVAYDPVQMRFLRIRASGGQNYAMETGPDLQTWNLLGIQGGAIVDPSPSYVEVGVLVAGAVAAATTVEFERVLFLGP